MFTSRASGVVPVPVPVGVTVPVDVAVPVPVPVTLTVTIPVVSPLVFAVVVCIPVTWFR